MRVPILALAVIVLSLAIPATHASVSLTCFSKPLSGIALVINASSGVVIGSYNASSIPLNPSPNLVAIATVGDVVVVANLSSSHVEVCSSKPTTLVEAKSIPVPVPGYLWIGEAQVTISLPTNVSLYGVNASLCLPLSPFVGSRMYVLRNLTIDGESVGGSCALLTPGNHTIVATYAAQLDLASPYVAIPSATLVAAIVAAIVYGFLVRRSTVARY